MKPPKMPARALSNLRRVKRKAISQNELVVTEPLNANNPLPLLIRPGLEGVSLHTWVETHRDLVRSHLHRHGGLLFRGFPPVGPEGLQRLIQACFKSEPLAYLYRSTPRTQVSGKIYTSTEYPCHESIPLHNECAYAASWPMRIVFYCATPPASGGETPIADSRKAFRRIDPAIRARFREKGVMYVRNYHEKEVDLSWREAFQTEDKAQVEAQCRAAGIQFEWLGANGLRTRQVCQGVARHPETGEETWFNQAHLFHVSSLKAEVREYLLETHSLENLPRNAYFGDGAEIETAVLDDVRAALDAEATVFPWQKGDVLMLDNMLVAHGRRPYRGERKILVGMADAFQAGDLR